jgi:hypothetical protein
MFSPGNLILYTSDFSRCLYTELPAWDVLPPPPIAKMRDGDTGTVVEVGNSPYIKIISHRTGMIGWINGGDLRNGWFKVIG